MTDEEKQTALEKNRILLIAIIDYHLEHYTGSMVFDQWDPAAEYYLQEKQQTEKDYQEFRLALLQQRLGNFVRRLQIHIDINFESYIKEQTGYKLDIFEELRQDVAAIVSKGRIENDEELKSAGLMIQVYQRKSVEKEQMDLLTDLIDEFAKPKHPIKITSEPGFSEVKHVIVQVKAPPPGSNSTVMADTGSTSRELSEADYAEFKRNNGLLSEHRAPDGRRQIMTRTNGIGKSALTEVSIVLKGGSGCIYCANGSSLLIKAYWKDNNTVVIETKKEYLVEIKHHTVRSFEDLVKIEYIES